MVFSFCLALGLEPRAFKCLMYGCPSPAVLFLLRQALFVLPTLILTLGSNNPA